MIYSYCKRCRMESPGDVCAGCGKRAAAASHRDKWSVASVPLADSRAWRTSVLALLGAAVLMLLTVFGLEAMCHVHAQFLFLQVPDVADAGLDEIIFSQELLDGVHLSGRLHDH